MVFHFCLLLHTNYLQKFVENLNLLNLSSQVNIEDDTVLLRLFNKLSKEIKSEVLLNILSLFSKKFTLNSIILEDRCTVHSSNDTKLILKSLFWCENIKIFVL